MNKKAVAVFCAVVLMISVFSACGKKELFTTEINGVKVPAVTNEKGEIVTNRDGEAAVYVTDESGEKVTASDGTPNINYIKPSAELKNPNGTISYDIFTIAVPDGWESDYKGKIVKKDTDMDCYISAEFDSEVDIDNSLESLVDRVSVTNHTLMDKINSGEGKDLGFEKGEMKENVLKFKEYEGHYFSFTVYNAKGEIVHYAESIYILVNSEKIYLLTYMCKDGKGYDKNFNFVEWAQNNITINAPTDK